MKPATIPARPMIATTAAFMWSDPLFAGPVDATETVVVEAADVETPVAGEVPLAAVAAS
jgi:hypothetical protein